MTEHKFAQSPLAKVSSLSWGVKGRRHYVHLAAGIDKPTRGRIHVLGDDIAQFGEQGVGALAQ